MSDTDGGGAVSKNNFALQTTGHDLKTKIKELEATKKELQKIDDEIADELAPKNRLQKALGKILGAKKKDGLSLIENRLRSVLNQIQGLMKDIGDVAYEKREEFVVLEEELRRAQEEGWPLEELRTFLVEKIERYSQLSFEAEGSESLPVISSEGKALLVKQVEFLAPEQVNQRTEELYNALVSHVGIGKELVRLLGNVLLASVDTFEKTGLQYYAFVAVLKPLQVIKEAGEVLTDSGKAMVNTQERAKAYVEKSIAGIGLSLDVIRLFHEYSLSSPVFQQFIEEKRAELEEKLNNLTESHSPEEEGGGEGTEESDVNSSS